MGSNSVNGEDIDIHADSINTTETLRVRTEYVDTIMIEHNGTEYEVVERGDGIALERRKR
jgi:hypothetical protein